MTRKRARNWSKSNQALVNQGSIIFWFKKGSQESWYARQEGGRGRPPVYSDDAILALMIIRAVYSSPFRQLQGLMQDFLSLIDKGCACPNYTTICRRSTSLRVPANVKRRGPLHVVFDSTGLKVYGEGEWKLKKHGPSYHRGWKKIHIGMCVETQQIVVASISDKELGDSQALPELLEAIDGDVIEVIGDGAYDTRNCYEAIHKRGARPTIPPRKEQGNQTEIHRYRRGIKQSLGYAIRNEVNADGKRRWGTIEDPLLKPPCTVLRLSSVRGFARGPRRVRSLRWQLECMY